MRTPPGKGGSPESAQEFEQKMEARLQQEEASGAVKKESLGTQSVNGVNAEGTRITRTIAAGQIGNDKAIQIVFERWYSPDLQLVVKSTRSDPRFGTTTYSLTNVHRTEPARHCSPQFRLHRAAGPWPARSSRTVPEPQRRSNRHTRRRVTPNELLSCDGAPSVASPNAAEGRRCSGGRGCHF
jgi:hypothetical protein